MKHLACFFFSKFDLEIVCLKKGSGKVAKWQSGDYRFLPLICAHSGKIIYVDSLFLVLFIYPVILGFHPHHLAFRVQRFDTVATGDDLKTDESTPLKLD